VDIGLHSFLLKIDSVLPVINPSLLVNYYSSSVLKCGKKQLFCWINMIQPPVVTRLSFQDGTTQWPQSHKSHIQQGLMSRERKSQLHSLYQIKGQSTLLISPFCSGLNFLSLSLEIGEQNKDGRSRRTDCLFQPRRVGVMNLADSSPPIKER